MWRKNLGLIILFGIVVIGCQITTTKKVGTVDDLKILEINGTAKEGYYRYNIGSPSSGNPFIQIHSLKKLDIGDKVILAVEKEDGTIVKF